MLCSRAPVPSKRIFSAVLRRLYRRSAPRPPPPPPPPPTPPKAPRKPVSFTVHGVTWEDSYSWMANLSDATAMRHMDMCMEQEEKYAEAAMAAAGADRLQRKLQLEMASRMASDPCSPPVKWGPWLYYRRIEEGKQYPVLCRRSVKLHEEFVSFSEPSAGFDFMAGRRIEQKILDYNQEAERFGGYAYEELSEISPDQRYLAYTMYDKDKDSFTLSVRDLATGSLCSKPQVDRVANLSWAMNGQALLYTVTNKDKRPHKIFCNMLGSSKDDVLILEEFDDSVFVNIRNTKDFRFVSVNTFSNTSSKVYLINAADPLSGLTLIWECEPHAHCIVEHHRGFFYLFTNAARSGTPVDSHYLLCCAAGDIKSRNWESLLVEEPGVSIEDIDFCDTHMVLIIKEGMKYRLCSIPLPLNGNGLTHLAALHPCFLPLPSHVCQISPGPNYDYYSSTMRFTISSPVMPDAVVDYDLSNAKWIIVQQQNVLSDRTRTLYGSSAVNDIKKLSSLKKHDQMHDFNDSDGVWNELTEFYACEYHDVPSNDEVLVPLTIVYSRKQKQEGSPGPGLLHGHGAYGELLDKRWRSELKSLLDRGWVVAYADVRGGGGFGRKWHYDGRRTKKQNSIIDYISCAEFLIAEGFVMENKLAGWGYSAGGLLVASAINKHPDLFRAAVLKVPFLDTCNTLLYPVLPLDAADYEEFGYPVEVEDFLAMKKCSPYDNIPKNVKFPSVMVTSSFNTRFGVWEAAKWVARVRENTIYDPKHPVVLNLTTDLVEDNKYLQIKELALETAFLIKMVSDS
ncbi:protease 2 [Dioscorea cayenensis subsp. rotundata]|uniref:Prolyl endopeptidase n=1 Tax=Dioscorea cayennensis subsp. rotundata TaxID=55577 RepID=A0AB40APT5_DIOCR|nr:protease 2 [Dioscorea cayenensis subsp. rotundata]